VSDLLKGRRALVTFCLTIVMICALCLYFFAPDKALILVGLFISGACIYAPLDLVGLMVNEAVPKYAVGVSTGFMGFFQYIFGDTIATALIGELVDRFGWGASSVVIFIAGGLCFILSLYLTYSERHIINMEKRANSLTPAEKAALEDPLSADEDVLRAAEAKVKGKKKSKK
ncbi:MAG: MFS transporter, partial [Aeriscardovia sp.]|nr:MFS transporter [Aeriscardovia sp.]